MAPSSSDYLVSGAEVEYTNATYSSIIMIGMTFKIEYLHSYNIENNKGSRNADSVVSEASYSFIPFFDNIISLNLAGGYGNSPDLFKERISGKTCFKSLPSRKIATNKYAGAGLSYEVPIYGNKSIAVSALAFGEGVALPTRMKFRQLPAQFVPKSETATLSGSVTPTDNHTLAAVVERWRGRIAKPRSIGERPEEQTREPALASAEAPQLQPHAQLRQQPQPQAQAASLDPNRLKLLRRPLGPAAPDPARR